MSLLLYFQKIRTPILDKIFLFFTTFGEEMICLVLICILFWCISKKAAYKLGFTFFISGILIQGLKVSFRIDRPWIKNSNLIPVDGAIENATGYSFPSGHTQIATSLYSTGAINFKNIILKILCVFLIIAVGFSRVYLGVHTAQDVLVSFSLTIIIAIFINKFFDKIYENTNMVTILFSTLSILLAILSFILMKSVNLEVKYVSDCFKAAGAGLGFAIGFFLERKYINFDEKRGTLVFQILKFVFGITILLILRYGIKVLLPQNFIMDMLRYFLMTFFALVLYPISVKKIYTVKNL